VAGVRLLFAARTAPVSAGSVVAVLLGCVAVAVVAVLVVSYLAYRRDREGRTEGRAGGADSR